MPAGCPTTSVKRTGRRLRVLAIALGVLGGAANTGLALWIWAAVRSPAGEPIWDPTNALRYAVALTALSALGLASALFLAKVPKLAGLLLLIFAGAGAGLSLVFATAGLTSYAGFLPAALLVPACILQMVGGGLSLFTVR